MPKRSDIESILIVGAGPIVIGQACEFDYSGTQACKALKAEGCRVILVNSNPATIMTDPDLADATYIEPITPDSVARIIEKEKPDALLPTMGGQTALNLAMALEKEGALARHGVRMIGASPRAIEKAEDRGLFKKTMESIGLETPRALLAHSEAEAEEALASIGLPAIIRPSFTLGGTGGGIAQTKEDFRKLIARGIAASPSGEILIEESVMGWKEYEMEVVRDKKDNCVIVCSIENLDPMGVHTGDSVTVAPALTLTDKEYQRMRTAAIAVLRAIGVETGGSNVQFALSPTDGRMVVIEMNPRVSRSSALASKATGFPIAKVAALLAIGYGLDELVNEITGATPASFEPTLDYVVTKIPRFAFEKFPRAKPRLTVSMKSVGEAMAIGRSFAESLQKALVSLETGLAGLDEIAVSDIKAALQEPTPDRLRLIAQAFREGLSAEAIHRLCGVDPWFLRQIQQIVQAEEEIRQEGLPKSADRFREIKSMGFSDARLAKLCGESEETARQKRRQLKIRPVYKRIDSCAAEFAAPTPYMYGTYEAPVSGEAVCEADPSDRKKAVILGGGPNRIGQGIEFDYCCCHASFALREEGVESVMVNCNPETVSTDYDTSDRLYFEPLTTEHVLEIIAREGDSGDLMGAIVQLGGQTPLKLAQKLAKEGVPILGTQLDAIDLAEDRERFQSLIASLGLKQPPSRAARSLAEARAAAEALGYPVMLRPSYVLGGRAMEIVRGEEALEDYAKRALEAGENAPLLVDSYLRDAIEVDVDALSDGETVVIAGVMEHIEEAGVHSGDSACALPPHSLSDSIIARIESETAALARALGVQGLMNVQYAVQEGEIYVLEVNPRASRTAPFVAKATGRAIVKEAARIMLGASLSDSPPAAARPRPRPPPQSSGRIAIKEAVFPFARFEEVDVILGPEMRSTGEVMGLDRHFGHAFAKSQLAAGVDLPKEGTAFLSVRDADKPRLPPLVKALAGMGFSLLATRGTADHLRRKGFAVKTIHKVYEGAPHIVDAIGKGAVQLVVNTTEGRRSLEDSRSLRRAALMTRLPYYTTLAGAAAAARGIEALRQGGFEATPLQKIHPVGDSKRRRY